MMVARPGWTTCLLGLIAGCAVQLQLAQLWPLAWSLALMLLGGLGAWWLIGQAHRLRASMHALAWLVLAFAWGLGMTGWRAHGQAQQLLDASLQGRDLWVQGVISDLPQNKVDGVRFRLRVEVATWEGQAVTVPGKLALGWYHQAWQERSSGFAEPGLADDPAPEPSAVALHAGQRWQMMVRLKRPHGAVNPFGFDSDLRLWEQGIGAVGYVRTGAKDPAPVLLGQSWRYPLQRARQMLRETLAQQDLQPGAAGVVAALVIGDQAAIERQDWQIFRATGIAHLMSISGLHITMFAWLAMRVLGLVWQRSSTLCRLWPAPHAALLGGVLLATLYALFSGWGIPAQRTILMLTVVSVLRMAGLRWPWPQVWLLACACVVALDPWALMQAGFWLSFVAVGVLFASALAPSGADRPGPGGQLLGLLREQALISLALAPLSLLLFGQFSLVGLLANVLAIPWVTLLVTPLAMAGSVVHSLWQPAVWAVEVLVAGLQILASWPWAVLTVAQAPWWVGALAVLGGLCLVLRLPWSLRAMGLPLLGPLLLWTPALPPAGEFELLAADVGQGNAVLVRTRHHALLYDAGPRFGVDSDAGYTVLNPLLRALAVRLDRLVLSHRDSDHTGGAAAVLAAHGASDVLSSLEDSHVLQQHASHQRCLAGQRWQWDGVDFEVLHPQAADYAKAQKPNAMSCVLRIANARASALLVGDIERQQEQRLLQTVPQALRADVLLVPHHGSKTSSSEAFLDAVQPRTALVQAGHRNRYGHPAEAVLARYSSRGIVLAQTPLCGAATWQSWRSAQVVCQRQLDRRYWRP